MWWIAGSIIDCMPQKMNDMCFLKRTHVKPPHGLFLDAFRVGYLVLFTYLFDSIFMHPRIIHACILVGVESILVYISSWPKGVLHGIFVCCGDFCTYFCSVGRIYKTSHILFFSLTTHCLSKPIFIYKGRCFVAGPRNIHRALSDFFGDIPTRFHAGCAIFRYFWDTCSFACEGFGSGQFLGC